MPGKKIPVLRRKWSAAFPALFLRIKRDQEEGKTKRNDGCGDINRDQEEGKTKQDDGCKLREIRGGLKLGHL